MKSTIVKAIELIGDQTSLATLGAKAEELWPNIWVGFDGRRWKNSSIRSYVCNVRSQWRFSNARQKDCRTYEGQPRRNMFNDSKVKRTTLNELEAYLGNDQHDTLLAILPQFHSLEQFTKAVEHCKMLASEYVTV